MSWLDDLDRELAANGISRRRARRIRLELADHLACDPDAPLGEPTEVAERFAVELRGIETRRAVLAAFGALALTAVLLLAAAGAGGPQQSWPRGAGHAANSTVASFAGLGLIAFSQIALVAGVLALVRGVRGGGAGDLRLAQRRALVALAAGSGVGVCLLVDAVAVTPDSGRWLAFVVAVGAVTVAACAAAGTRVRVAAALTPPGEPAPGLSADLPGLLGRQSGALLAVLAAGATGLVVVQGVVGEQSVVEGIVRGGIEAVGLFLGVVLLGRLLGLRR